MHILIDPARIRFPVDYESLCVKVEPILNLLPTHCIILGSEMTGSSSRTETLAEEQTSPADLGTEVETKLTELESGDDERARDLGFLPIPKRLRYHPDRPFHFGVLLNIAFGFASTFSKC